MLIHGEKPREVESLVAGRRILQVLSHFPTKGIIISNGQIWQNNRRFTLRHLRDLGMGKTRLEEAIQHEAVCLVEDFARHAGRPGPLPWSINVAVLNVIWQMVASRWCWPTTC